MINYNSEKKVFKIDTENTSYIFGIRDDFGYLTNFYYGRRLDADDVTYLAITADKDTPSNNTKDKLSFLDCEAFEYPTAGIGDFRPAALDIEDANGVSATELSVISWEIYNTKKTLTGLPATFGDNAECLDIILEDKRLGARVILTYSIFEDSDAIIRSAKVVNVGTAPFKIKRIMSLNLDMDEREYEMITLAGTWARERAIDRKPLRHGFQCVSSERGITSAQEHPFIAMVTPETNQTLGEVYAFNFVYSGNFEAGAYVNQFGNTRITMGINPYHFSWKLAAGEEFTTPEAVMVYSSEGLGKMTRVFHDLYRNHIIRSPYKNQKRPILINNWEATYFDFTTEKLLAIAREASKSGIEMLVMDDGWFGDRHDDNRALGDWIVNEEKLQGGLKYLVDEVNKLGMKFGIWFEPEMICPDSDLFRAHPDWALSVEGRTTGLCRNQIVLDLTRPEVLEHTWNSIKSVMDSANIEYVKWDMNRPLAEVSGKLLTGEKNGEFFHRYMLAVYELQERLITTYPNLLLENCSSGGGRFDPGMFYYSPQIWCSDDTDAIERLCIQEGTALIYPLSTMGAHVSDCPNHVLGRSTPFETRGHVALAGTFGYELDITRISEEDRNQIRGQVDMYHKYNDLVREGDYHRLASFSENGVYDSWMVKKKDSSECLVTFVSVLNHPNYKPFRLRLQGLDPKKKYKDEETGTVYGGDTLMYAGLKIDRMWGDYKSKLIHLTEI